jgi:iron complex transport system permease protein
LTGRRAWVLVGAALVLLFLMAVGVSLGSERLSLAEVWDGLTNPNHSTERIIVWDLRLPRVILAVLVGANLAVAGALLQGVTRNPLADPHLLGISAGSGVVGALLLVRGVDIPLEAKVALSILGGMAGGAFIYAMAWRGGVSPTRLTLAGVAVSFLLISMTTAILASSRLFAQQSLNFVGGSLFARGWDDLSAVWPYTVVGLLLALAASAPLNVMALGEDAAAELGVRTGWVRAIAVVLAVVLSGAAVSVAGLMGFVGLIIPHIARALVGQDYRYVLVTSALLGGILLVGSDTLARNILGETELPAGVVTAGVGAPFFLYLLRQVR